VCPNAPAWSACDWADWSGARTLKKVGRLQHEALTRSELGAQAGVKGKTLGFAEEA